MSKIIVIGPAWPLRGGIATYNERMVKEFQNTPGDYKIYTFKKQYPNLLFPGKTQFSESPKPEGLNIDVCLNSINPVNWIRIGRRLKKENADYIIVRYWMPFFAPCFGTILRLAKKNHKTKIISLVDNLIPHEKMPLGGMLTKFFAKVIDGFLVMTESVKADVLRVTNKPVELHPHPLFDNFPASVEYNSAKEALKLDANSRYLMFFGLIRKYKGIDMLIEAISKIPIQKTNYKLIIAGEFYEDINTYLKLIKEKKLEEHVTVINKFIEDNDIPKYFSAVDALILPYRTATQSGVTQIAYYYNKPMIVTNVGGLPEIVPDNKCGYVAEPTSESLALAIEKFIALNNPDHFVENIIEYKKIFSWDGLVTTINKLYARIK